MKYLISSRVILSVILICAMLMLPVSAVSPKYNNLLSIMPSCNISGSGKVECGVFVSCTNPSLDLNVTARLYCDDNDYEMWTYSDRCVVDETETCYVQQGHEYYFGISVRATDANGNIIDECVRYTDLIVY